MKAVALLCDYATVAEGKLFVSGGGINNIGVVGPADRYGMNSYLALSVTVPWNATNQVHKLSIELVYDNHPAGAGRVPIGGALPTQDPETDGMIFAEFNVGRGPNTLPGMDQPIPVAIPLNVRLPGVGTYFIEVKIDGTPVDRVSFQVQAAAQVLMAG